MDPNTLKKGDQIEHPDFGVGTFRGLDFTHSFANIEWDRQGSDQWALNDNRWEQVLLA